MKKRTYLIADQLFKIKVKETKKTKTLISYVVKDTTIREHIAKETGTFKYQGKMYTFVKLRMNKEVFDQLIAEAKNAKASQNN